MAIKEFVRWSDSQGKGKAWADVSSRTVADFKAYLKTEVREKGRPLTNSSINMRVTALRSFYGWLREAGYIDLYTPLPTDPLKFEKLGTGLPQHFSPEELALIWAAVEGDAEINLRDRALLAVLTHGLRADDASCLNIENYLGTELRFGIQKDHDSGIRVPLRRSARQHIDTYLTHRKHQGELLLPESPLILSCSSRNRGERLAYSGINAVMMRLESDTGIANLNAHRFRHTFASEIVERGIDPALAMELTGHRSPKVFEGYVRGKKRQAAIDKFMEALGDE